MSQPTEDLGTYLQYQGRPAVRFVRTYRHPIERVWAAIARPEELAAWFPSAVDFEPGVGSVVKFSDDPNVEGTTGTVLAYEPPRRLSFTWYEDELHLMLEPTGLDSCRLTLVDVLADPETAARSAGGWSVCLAELRKDLDGVHSGGPHSPDAEPWRPIYERHVDAGLPSGAPIPDGV
jgi:uncharacterized protein YndB with AHSA1/START domain